MGRHSLGEPQLCKLRCAPKDRHRGRNRPACVLRRSRNRVAYWRPSDAWQASSSGSHGTSGRGHPGGLRLGVRLRARRSGRRGNMFPARRARVKRLSQAGPVAPTMATASKMDSKTPRLIHLNPYASLYTGGFVPMIRAVLERATNIGWRSTAVFDEGARLRPWVSSFRDAGLELRFLEASSRLDLVRSLGRMLDEDTAPAVLHTHFTTFDLPAALAAQRRAYTPVFWHVHSALPRDFRSQMRNAVKFRLGGLLIENILCVGPHLAEGVIGRGAPRRKVLVVPNAIETERFPLINAEERAAARSVLGLRQDAEVLLHFGWNWSLKGGDLFFAIVKLLRDRGRRAVIGTTVAACEPARNLAGQIGLEDNIAIVPPREDVRTLYAAADVFVATSRSEGAPTAVLQALSSGLPVVATSIPGHASIGAELDLYRLADVSAASLADAVEAALERPSRADRDAAHRWVRTKADLSDWSNRIVELYVQAIGR
jgi:glycosyltransferase involved in cell wall biosynthesis